MNKSLKDFFNYFFSDLMIKGFLFVSLPLLSRLLSPEDYGRLSLINSTIMILFVFVSFNIQNAISNRVMKSKDDIGEYIYSNLVFIIPIQILIILSSFFYADYICKLFSISSTEFQWVLVISSLLSTVYIYTSYLQGTEQSRKFAIINVSGKVFEIILIFIFATLLTQDKYLSKIYAQGVILVLTILCIFPAFKNILVFKFKKEYIKDSLIFSIPLIPHVVSNSLLSQADRFIITKKLGFTEAGIYSFSYNLGMAIIVIIMAWNSSWLPKLYKRLNENNISDINSIINSVCLVIGFLAFGNILFSREMVMIMTDHKYYEAQYIMPIIIIGNSMIFIYQTYSNFTLYTRKTIYISIATVISLFINIILNFKLIPIYGVIGAAWATVVSYLLLSLLHYLFARLVFGELPVSISVLFKFCIVVFSGYFLTLFVNSEFSFFNSLMIKITITLLVFCFAFYKRNTIKFI
ncbi:TPA: oligosaccharide flippase family protein [Photobacterium damselae]